MKDSIDSLLQSLPSFILRPSVLPINWLFPNSLSGVLLCAAVLASWLCVFGDLVGFGPFGECLGPAGVVVEGLFGCGVGVVELSSARLVSGYSGVKIVFWFVGGEVILLWSIPFIGFSFLVFETEVVTGLLCGFVFREIVCWSPELLLETELIIPFFQNLWDELARPTSFCLIRVYIAGHHTPFGLNLIVSWLRQQYSIL